MNVVLWTVQFFLAAVFVVAGASDDPAGSNGERSTLLAEPGPVGLLQVR